MLKGKTAIVTGGGSGIGRSIALELACNGATVYILGRTEAKLVDTVMIAKRRSLNIQYKVCDVSNANEVKTFFNELSSVGLAADIIVNNAGIICANTTDCSVGDETILRVNTIGVINICTTAINRLVSLSKPGVVVNIASLAGHNGSSEFPAYAASKGAVISYTKSLALKFGKNGIRANSISPGVIVTPMSYIETPSFDDYVPDMIAMHPLQRLGTPEDISKVVLFLVSDMSSFVTGQDIIVDGGFTLRE